jgi:translation initiation factor 1
MKDTKLVWTSDPEAAKKLREGEPAPVLRDEEPSKQTIRVVVDRKRRNGKAVTVASGFALTEASLTKLSTALKKRCGAGGTSRDGEIEIQGEHVSTVATELQKLGYRVR